MKELWTRFAEDESGQGLVEYVLIVAIVAIGLVTIMYVFRNSIGNIFKTSANTLNNAPGAQYQ
ncbi:MAG TPA: Flp family type IVb pilin [Longimicrobiales bacterium]|nr:Flp family type IVb pilin [Longimicrobiales bacterium]